MTADVTLCIPTWRSADFIERTIKCALAQTFHALRVVVSVDPSDDATSRICMRLARTDSRLTIIVQPRRLGWSQNANAALSHARTKYAGLYFHDDIIEPTYVEHLVDALETHPDAFSAHCDLVEFGLLDTVRPAHTYTGSALRRLIDFMLTQRGTTLRSLFRNEHREHTIAFPLLEGDGPWTAFVFHLRLLAAGPAIGVHQPLYRRWQREGSMTRAPGWRADSLAATLCQQAHATALCVELLDAASSNPDQRETGLYCLHLFQRLFTLRQQLGIGEYQPVRPDDFCETLSDACLRPQVLDETALGWIHAAEQEAVRLAHEIIEASDRITRSTDSNATR